MKSSLIHISKFYGASTKWCWGCVHRLFGDLKRKTEISNYNKQYIELWAMSEEPMNKNLTMGSFAKAMISLN